MKRGTKLVLEKGESVVNPKTEYCLFPLSFLHSPLKHRAEPPNQGSEGTPDAWLKVNTTFAEGLV